MVYVYALCNVNYDSYYLKGLEEIFSGYTFDVDRFPKFKQGVFAIIISNQNVETKIIIDSRDTSDYNEDEIGWCDVYGKINYNVNTVPEKYKDKIVPIGPSFGIRLWNFPTTIFMALKNYFGHRKSIYNRREFFANYWRQYKRLPLKYYSFKPSVDKYIFFTATIWRNEPLTNLARASFIKASKKINSIVFEGGFAPRHDGNNLGFDSLAVSKRYTLVQYIEKTRSSAIVFNTPAVLSCHGWKLAEFLALGKAIITNQHINTLPAELKPNVHAVYVDTNEGIEDKINTILSDPKFKQLLEKNSRHYYEEHLAPKVVIEKLLSFNSSK